MVIDQPHGDDPPVSRFWFEAARDAFPWWLPLRLEGYWSRWRRIGPKRKLAMRELRQGMVVPFQDETEYQQMVRHLERCEG